MSLAMGTIDGEVIHASGSEESDCRKAQAVDAPANTPKAKPTLISSTAREKSPKMGGSRFPTPQARTKVAGIGLGMMKTAQSGLKTAPVAASKAAPGASPTKAKSLAEVKPDPLILAMQQMTAAFGNMDQELKGMNHSLTELQQLANEQEERLERGLSSKKKEPGPRPLIPQNQMNPEGSGPFYAVAFGANGHQWVYSSWSECATWVIGIPGNVFQTFASL
jgi:hypothetical protein